MTGTNIVQDLLASANRVASGTLLFRNLLTVGGTFTLDVTAFGGTTPTLDGKFQIKDMTSGKFVDIPGASFTQNAGAVNTKTLTLYPGVTPSANVAVSIPVPRDVLFVWTIGGSAGPNFTFSLGYSGIGG